MGLSDTMKRNTKQKTTRLRAVRLSLLRGTTHEGKVTYCGNVYQERKSDTPNPSLTFNERGTSTVEVLEQSEELEVEVL